LGTTDIVKMIANNTHLFAASASGEVYNTPLASISWSLTSGLPSGIKPTSFATDGSSHVFLGTQTQGVFMCMDNQSWMASNGGLTNMNINALVISGSTLFAGTNGGVFKRALMGTWSAANNGLPTQTITSLGAAGQWVAAGFKGGVYTTYDNGTLWKAPNVMQYIPEFADITEISFSALSTRIFVATPYNCLYSNGIGELPTGLRTIQRKIGSILLFPNPTTGTFTLDFQNIDAEVESVSVFDQLGKCIYNANIRSSNHSTQISLDIPSGIYSVSIQTNNGLVSQTLVIN
jgi:hypothetical protein